MLSRSFLLHHKHSKDSIFLFKCLLLPIPDVQNPYLNSLSFSTLPPQPCPDSGYKLNHKDWLSPNEVTKIFANLRDPKLTLSLWNQYCRRKDYKPNEAIYTVVINQLSQAKNFDAIEDIMQRIKLEKSCRLSNEFFYSVIKIYAHSAGRIMKALETFLDMPKGYNCWPNVKTFNLVLNFLVSAKLFEEVQELYLQAPMLGVEIDACCLNILIKGLCANGDLSSALKVFDEFPKQRCRPNVRTFSTLMHYLCAKGEVEEAFRLFDQMENEGIEADTITFNILISGLMKLKKIDEGRELLVKMKLKGCEPNEASYQEVLYGLLDVGKFLEAKEFMGEMISKRMNPSLSSYKKVVRGLCKADLIGDVELVIMQMVKQGFVPGEGMWKSVTRSLFRGTNIVRTFSTLMYYLSAKGEVKEAFGLFDQMESEGIEADTTTFNILISGLRKQKKIEEGRELLEKMRLRGCEPNEASYQEVLYGLLDVGKFVEAKEFMGEMISKRVNPSLLSYEKVVKGLCKENLIGDVELVMMQMVKQGIVPNKGMWKSVTRSLFLGANVDNKSLDEITSL